ncbi:MAG: hypothetical protein GY782_12145 [Gammaproteobacteria bacterium]|nr:hypothetical protein [Gammaproteobacteria bacterium]
MTARFIHVLTAIVIFAAGAAIFTLFLPDQFTLAEAHAVLLAQGISHHGWLPIAKAYPGVYDSHFSAIPSLIYFMTKIPGVKIAISARTAVLPAAAASGLTLAFTYLISVLRSKQWGTMSVLFLFSIEAFFLHSRTLSAYPFLVAVITLTLFFTIIFETEGILFYIMLVLTLLLGFAVSGAIGLLLPLLMVVIYLLWRRQWMKCLCAIACGIATLVAAEAILFGLALELGGGEIALVQKSFAAQLAAILPHTTPIWSQDDWHELLYFILPLVATIFTVIGCWRLLAITKQSWEMQFIRSQVTWIALIIALIIFLPKPAPFMLLTAPSLAITGAYLFNYENPSALTVLLRHLLTFAFIVIPLLTLLLTGAAFVYNRLHHNAPSDFYLSATVLLTFLTILAFFLGFPGAMRRHKNCSSLLMNAIIAYLIFNLAIVVPILTYHRQQQHKLVPAVVKLSTAHPKAKIVFYQIKPGNEDQLFMVRLPWQKNAPTFIDKSAAIAKSTPGSYFIASSKAYAKLPQALKSQTKIITKGNVNKRSLLLFTYGTATAKTKK